MIEQLAVLQKIAAEQEKTKVILERIWGEMIFSNLGPERNIEFIYEDTKIIMHIPFAQNDFIQSSIMRNKTFFEEPILRRLRKEITPGSNILDIGANIGNHAVYFSKFCGAKSVIAFEPQKIVGALFSQNIALNSCENVKFFNKAAGKSSGFVEIVAFRANNLGATSFAAAETGGFEAMCIDELRLDSLGFIKMDVEGAQMDALAGARHTIERFRPKIFIELLVHRGEFQDANDFLASMGYKFEKISQDNFLYSIS